MKLKRSFLRKIINRVKIFFPNTYALKSYSQEGEDLILRRHFEDKRKGFYVDVGAHHPFRFSNTYIFYKKGWCGMNIDAMPGSMEPFNKFRSRDINLEIAVSDKSEELTYYAFEEPALNSLSRELSEEIRCKRHKILFTKKIQTETLESILDQHLPKDQQIDFLSIDVEGLDYRVLKSNNWKKYRPEVVLVESLAFSWEQGITDPSVDLLATEGYKLLAKTNNTLIFTL